MEFQKDLSHLGWNEVKKRQLQRFSLVSEWVNLAGIKQGYSILDIGSGPGIFICEYAKLVGMNGKVIAVEQAEEAVQLLIEQKNLLGLENIFVINSNAEEKILTNEQFNTIFLTDVLHHSSDPLKILKNVVFLSSSETVILVSEFDFEAEGKMGPPLKNRIPISSMEQLLKNAGLQIFDIGKLAFEHYYILAKCK